MALLNRSLGGIGFRDILEEEKGDETMGAMAWAWEILREAAY
jgi:hypothetical protein